MNIKINGEEAFKALNSSFSVQATSGGYTLEFSVDKETWTAVSTPTPANENLMVININPYTYFRLAGNTDNNVEVIL